jgi:hypothetical protein
MIAMAVPLETAWRYRYSLPCRLGHQAAILDFMHPDGILRWPQFAVGPAHGIGFERIDHNNCLF